jgi:pimeloyl-ACP methyl ester carboxylesterase
MGWLGIEKGEGAPLVLLHGIGMAASAWAPVLDQLAATRRAIALDLPGCGRTPPLGPGIEPTPAAIASALVEEMTQRGVDQPFDVAGNSLGGFVALELAKSGHARSVVALSPAGLWHGHAPRMPTAMLKAMHVTCRRAPGLVRASLRIGPVRAAALWVPVTTKGWRVPAAQAIEAAENFGRSSGFEQLADAAEQPFRGGQQIKVPVTVAFGDRDLLLRPGSCRFRDQLPAHTRWVTIPGSGHVPMWDNSEAVARIVLAATETSIR